MSHSFLIIQDVLGEIDPQLQRDAENILELFSSCRMAASLLNAIEWNLYETKILSCQRKCDYLPYLERLLYELSSDTALSNGVFYALTLRQEGNEPGKLKKSGLV